LLLFESSVEEALVPAVLLLRAAEVTPVRYAVDPWVATVIQGATDSVEGVSTGICQRAPTTGAVGIRTEAGRAVEY
jgi:hypothetical protein